eukprot:TRINITY_DN15249_c0_g1_i2.p1 TRINITY_DN15249_c0_g1~~TRINITY_DN15249_c0_g1_i2.p1  ORF type:complete len:158 (-),score=36.63 TRINITY_DN15249_c0_g1_i2:17-490(-)
MFCCRLSFFTFVCSSYCVFSPLLPDFMSKSFFFFFQAEDGIRDAQESRGLGDVYKRQAPDSLGRLGNNWESGKSQVHGTGTSTCNSQLQSLPGSFGNLQVDDCMSSNYCLLYTSDAADEEDSVDLGGRRINEKKKKKVKSEERKDRKGDERKRRKGT